MLLAALVSLASLPAAPAPARAAELERVALIATRQDVVVRAKDDVDGATVRVSVPLAFEAQTPVAFVVTSEPPERVRASSLVAEREGRPLEVELVPLTAGAEVRLSVRALVLVAERDVDDLRGVRAASRDDVPEDVREHLSAAPGVEPEHPEVVALARELSRKDLHATVSDVLGFLEREIPAAAGPQGASAVLALRGAACTGRANLAASLLIAAGVPTRILPCILVGLQQQEHYIVEVWAPGRGAVAGWTRIEPTLGSYPPADERHVVLRVTHADDPRSYGDVPSYLPRASEGLDASFAFFDGTSSFQEAHRLDDATLGAEDLALIVDGARAAADRLVLEPAAGARARLVSSDDTPERLSGRGRRLLARLRELEDELAER